MSCVGADKKVGFNTAVPVVQIYCVPCLSALVFVVTGQATPGTNVTVCTHVNAETNVEFVF